MNEMKVPRINANDETVEIAFWYLKDGEWVNKGEDLVDLGTSKATITIQSEFSGYVKLLHKVRKKIRVGAPFAEFSDTPIDNKLTVASDVDSSSGFALDKGNTRFSKSAMDYLLKHGLSVDAFQGRGLVTLEMVVEQNSRDSKSSKLRKKRIGAAKALEIEKLACGQSGGINSFLFVQFPAAPLVARVEKMKGLNGSLLPVILFELAKLLPEYPLFTAYFSDSNIIFYDEVSIGLAIDVGSGLKVVTIKDAGNFSATELHERIVDFSMRDIRNELTENDLMSSTFTVTDLSAQNIFLFQPLINGKQSAILGIGADSEMSGHPFTLNLTFDHRVLDGRQAATFLNRLKQNILASSFFT